MPALNQEALKKKIGEQELSHKLNALQVDLAHKVQVLEGAVEVLARDGWRVAAKPGQACQPDLAVRIGDGASLRYASRGGLKLAAALRRSGMPVAGATVLDVGQSTGGFTDCLLQAGAARVIGIDSAH